MFKGLYLSLGIDLGTANTLVGLPEQGIIFDQASLIARRKKKLGKLGEVLAYGSKVREMIGREPRKMKIISLLNNGAIADLDSTVLFLKYVLDRVNQLPSRWPRLLKPSAVIGVPSGITEVEKRAVRSAALESGVGKAALVEEPIAAALGAGLTIDKSTGSLLIDIGGGTTEIALVSLGGIVLNQSLTIAGQEMDEAIQNFLRIKYGILVGQISAEKIKKEIGSVMPRKKPEKTIVKGRDLETGLPKQVEIEESEVREAIGPIIQQIITALDEIIEQSPPELVADLSHRGIVLTGGGSQLFGLDEKISQLTRIPVWRAKRPEQAVVLGCIKLVQDSKLLKRVSL